MLESSTFLKDDCLKINYTVGVVVSVIDSSRLQSIHVPQSDIGTEEREKKEKETMSV